MNSSRSTLSQQHSRSGKKELASGETPASAVFGHNDLNATGIGWRVTSAQLSLSIAETFSATR
jgi:hypothetical protein